MPGCASGLCLKEQDTSCRFHFHHQIEVYLLESFATTWSRSVHPIQMHWKEDTMMMMTVGHHLFHVQMVNIKLEEKQKKKEELENEMKSDEKENKILELIKKTL